MGAPRLGVERRDDVGEVERHGVRILARVYGATRVLAEKVVPNDVGRGYVAGSECAPPEVVAVRAGLREARAGFMLFAGWCRQGCDLAQRVSMRSPQSRHEEIPSSIRVRSCAQSVVAASMLSRCGAGQTCGAETMNGRPAAWHARQCRGGLDEMLMLHSFLDEIVW